ncbi:MAG: hypothetical protein K0S09_1728 [Sphingobacteriaceae bacterium]|jgi:hypothetical protein|nr:hypothetical protein [Sphingobacteriaceae bacterium]
MHNLLKTALAIVFFIACFLPRLFAQQTVQGVVFDRDSKQRLTRVYIYNTRTHKGFYNNSRGEFFTDAAKGDTLVAALQGYHVDTATVKSESSVVIYLKRSSIVLKDVSVTDTTRSPRSVLENNKKEYDEIYRKGNDKDLLKIGGGNNVGVGLSIDALWSLFSREGKNARYLQQILERDYREAMIDYRYTKTLVGKTTSLTGKALEDFMHQYRPSYYFIVEANDYMLINFIRSSYQKYLQNPAARRLPSLGTPR